MESTIFVHLNNKCNVDERLVTMLQVFLMWTPNVASGNIFLAYPRFKVTGFNFVFSVIMNGYGCKQVEYFCIILIILQFCVKKLHIV